MPGLGERAESAAIELAWKRLARHRIDCNHGFVPSEPEPAPAETAARSLRYAFSRLRPARTLSVRRGPQLYAERRCAEGDAVRAARASWHRARRGGPVG